MSFLFPLLAKNTSTHKQQKEQIGVENPLTLCAKRTDSRQTDSRKIYTPKSSKRKSTEAPVWCVCVSPGGRATGLRNTHTESRVKIFKGKNYSFTNSFFFSPPDKKSWLPLIALRRYKRSCSRGRPARRQLPPLLPPFPRSSNAQNVRTRKRARSRRFLSSGTSFGNHHHHQKKKKKKSRVKRNRREKV